MTTQLLVLTLSASVLALGACSPAAAPDAAPAENTEPASTAPAGEIEVSASFDASGYLVPLEEITVAGWSIDHLFIGHSTDFTFWREAGAAVEEVPVWLSLNPVDGETAVNEMGATYYLDSRRIRPHDLTLTDGAFEFRAQDSELGDILISGMIQADALQERGNIPQSDPPALTAGVEMGGEHIRNAGFMHWRGD